MFTFACRYDSLNVKNKLDSWELLQHAWVQSVLALQQDTSVLLGTTRYLAVVFKMMVGAVSVGQLRLPTATDVIGAWF